MKVYKFGGASVKDADGVRNLANILRKDNNIGNVVVVISAMGKMTNYLEEVCHAYFKCDKELLNPTLNRVREFHYRIISELGISCPRADVLIQNLEEILSEEPSLSYDYEYDRIVSFGEMLSTSIVSAYLESIGIDNTFLDARRLIRTDDNYRDANIDIEISKELCNNYITFNEGETKIYITQGFIAGTLTNQTTTLGREGSDYSAAILAYLLNAENVTIWKDVPGIMNADPNKYESTEIIPLLSYKEAIEMAHYGAKVIHPKTIKPLENKNIALYVKSFLKPESEGSVIRKVDHPLNLVPIYIDKENQVLLTISPRDFSFIAEERLSDIFSIMAQYKIKLNMIQTSAISFTVCIDYHEDIFDAFIEEISNRFRVQYNLGVKLLTIRHYNQSIIDKLIKDYKPLMEDGNRLTVQFVLDK